MALREALAALRTLAVTINEPDLSASAERLLERAAGRDDAYELRAALVWLGARVIIDPVGGARMPVDSVAMLQRGRPQTAEG